MENKKTIYSFLGLPASGKGTQAAKLAEKYNLQIIGVGDLVRAEIKKDTADPFVMEIKKRYDAGVPQPDSVAIDLVKNYLENLETGVIFDNFPFTQSQADFLDQFIAQHTDFEGPVVIYIKTDPEEVIKRAISRKVCVDCGAIYGATDEMICEKCGGSLVVRSDDNEETMRTRINFYLPKIKEVVELYGEKVITIDGNQPVTEVTRQIFERV